MSGVVLVLLGIVGGFVGVAIGAELAYRRGQR